MLFEIHHFFALQFVLTIIRKGSKKSGSLGRIHHINDVRWMRGGCRGAGPFSRPWISSLFGWLGLRATPTPLVNYCIIHHPERIPFFFSLVSLPHSVRVFPLFREATLVVLLVEETRERDCREGTLGSNEGAAGYK